MDRDDLIERAAVVIDLATREKFSRTIPYEATSFWCDGEWVREASQALADAGLLRGEKCLSCGAVGRAMADLVVPGDPDPRPLPEQVESLVSAYRDVWRWWEKSVARSKEVEATLASVEPILALLHYRGLVDSREDVRDALARVRSALNGRSQS